MVSVCVFVFVFKWVSDICVLYGPGGASGCAAEMGGRASVWGCVSVYARS